MQINSQRPADFYPPVAINRGQSSQVPVVFDASKTLNFVPATQTAARQNQIAPVEESDNGQTARYVRYLSAEKESTSTSTSSSGKLPRSLQTYEEIESFTSPFSPSQRGQYLDETV
jgi:hypothetical protein